MNKEYLQGRKDLTEPTTEKEFLIRTKIEFVNYITAEDEEDAKRIIKEIFANENNINLYDNEIISVEEIE